MSFSITIFEKDIESTLDAALDDKVASIPNEKGKAEATALRPAMTKALVGLVTDNGEFSSAYISGSISEHQNANFSVSVSFKNPNAPVDEAPSEEGVEVAGT